MSNMTLSLPDEISAQMRHYSEIRWSEVARKAIIERLETLQLADKLAQKSKLTEQDVKEFGALIKKEAAKKFRSSSTQTSSSQH